MRAMLDDVIQNLIKPADASVLALDPAKLHACIVTADRRRFIGLSRVVPVALSGILSSSIQRRLRWQGAEDAIVFGVSTDSPFCHAAFKKQYNIPYDLLADTSRKVSKDYNLFMGEQPYNCSKRGTVIIDKNGRISYWHEQPTREARKVDDLAKAVAM
jgi:peroxiredoxin